MERNYPQKLQLVHLVIFTPHTGCSGFCTCFIYFEKAKRQTVHRDLSIKTQTLLIELSHYIRNNFRSERKNDVSYKQLEKAIIDQFVTCILNIEESEIDKCKFNMSLFNSSIISKQSLEEE